MEEIKNCLICGSENFIHLFQCKDHFLSLEMFSVFQCKKCGFRFTNPRPKIEKLAAYYNSVNYISYVYKPETLIDKIYNRVRKYTLQKKYNLVCKYKTAGKILDIGCGTGEFLKLFIQNNWEVFGIEPDNSARNIAKTKNGVNVFDETYLNNFPEGEFDIITMWHVLEHVSDINSQITLIRKILKKDGVLIIAVPNSDSFDAQTYRQYWAAYDMPRHLYHFTKKSIKDLFNKFDFEINDILPMKFDAFYISLISEKYKSGKSNFVPAIINGIKSNLKAGRDNNYSSLTYIIKHKKVN